jgi:hypothetical protein
MICMTERYSWLLENAHFLNPGTGNSSRRSSPGSYPGVGRASASAHRSDGGFSSSVRGCTLSLVCGSSLSLGKGTPAPIDAPKVRSPGTLSMGSQSNVYCRPFGGDRSILRSFLLVGYALLVWLVVHLFVVSSRSPLCGQFGGSYETHLRTVRRWLPFPTDMMRSMLATWSFLPAKWPVWAFVDR